MSRIGKKILSIINNNTKGKVDRGTLLPFDQASSVGLLYTWKDSKKEAIIGDFKLQLEEGKTVDALCYNPDKNDIIETKNPIVSVNDLSLLGKINSNFAEDFLRKKFDYLFHLDYELSEITETLLINSNANCRVGLHTENAKNHYELMIGINESAGLEHLIEQMLKYVNALK